MTETQIKLRDAATQMKLALKNNDNEDILRSCINSYISFARSVTFIMQKESAQYPQLLSWYEGKMEKLRQLPLLKFFNAQRVHSIHKGNISPIQQSTRIWDIQYGTKKMPGEGIMTVWLFDEIEQFIPGDSGNVFRLCEQYFLILKQLVHEWLQEKTKMEAAENE